MTTHVLVITDMSGSMAPLAADVRGGFNSYIDKLRDEPDGEFKITVCVFDTEIEVLCQAVPLSEVPRLTVKNYQPRGMTALLDAIGTTVVPFKSDTLGEDDRALVVIQTDGQENSSREFTKRQIKKLIAEREATGKWSFVYLGAGADAWDKGASFGASQVVNTANTSVGLRATYDGLYRGTVAYARGASADGATQVIADAASVDKQ